MTVRLVLVAMILVCGCGNGDEDAYVSSGRTARTYLGAELACGTIALGHDDTVILQLRGAAAHGDGLGGAGRQVVTYEFAHRLRQTVCLEDGDETAYRLEVRDDSDAVVAHLRPGECEEIAVAPGRYHFAFSFAPSDGLLMDASPLVFLRPYAETTHCEDYENRLPTSVGDTGLEAAGDCIAGPTVGCYVPERYSDLPYECPLGGPWDYSEQYECVQDQDSAAKCEEFLYRDCALLESFCLDYWADYTDDFTNWGNSGAMVWKKCFAGSDVWYVLSQHSNIADPIIISSFQRYAAQYCAAAAEDCATGWTTTSPAPAGCPGFVAYRRHGGLALQAGQVAVHQRTYLHTGRNAFSPREDDVVLVIEGRCDSIPHRVGAYTLGPNTQAVVYPFAGMAGKPHLFQNVQASGSERFALPRVGRRRVGSEDPTFQSMLASAESSITVLPMVGDATDLCRVKEVGVACDDPTPWDLEPRKTGDVVLVGIPDASIGFGRNCAQAFLVDYRCDDLAKLKLANRGPAPPALSRVIVADADTILRSFAGTDFKGSVVVSQGEGAGPSVVWLDGETIGSAYAYRVQDYNHTILVSLRRCCGCNLRNVRFVDKDLSHTVLVGSDMSGASFKDTDLTGADLRQTSLRDAFFDSVVLGGNSFGCADMASASMADPDGNDVSTVSLVGPGDWRIDSVQNGIRITCDEQTTDLTDAKVPIQLLPTDKWTEISLEGATLLDKVDGYDLSGIDLGGRNYSRLRAGGRELKMRGANLAGADLSGADFSSVDFGPLVTDRVARYTDFSGARIGGASFANANLEGADFVGVIRDGRGIVNFSYSLLINAVFRHADLGSADFSNAYFFSKFRENVTAQKKAAAEDLIFQGAKFSGAFLSNMTFVEAKLMDTNFHAAQLVGTTFIAGRLDRSSFADAYLHGANFSDASLEGANLTGAFLSLAAGYWHYSSGDPECTDIRIGFDATDLGQTDETTFCPSGEIGPCRGQKLSRKDEKTVEPPCVDGDEDIFGNTDCITHEHLKRGVIPVCDDSNEDVMQCGCLVLSESGR